MSVYLRLNELSKEERAVNTVLVHWVNLWRMKPPKAIISKMTLCGIGWAR